VTTYDPGLQRERTAMAWTRTGLALLVNALVTLRAGASAGQSLILVLGFLLLASAGAAVGCGAWRARRLANGADPATPWFLVLATVGVTWMTSIAACLSIVATLD
jgi:uncharacterized membrane protein YidH (DUF202 family)